MRAKKNLSILQLASGILQADSPLAVRDSCRHTLINLKDFPKAMTEVRLMHGHEAYNKLAVEATSQIRDELVEAAYKDGIINDQEREQFLKSRLYASVIDGLLALVYKNFSYKDFEDKSPRVLKWFKKYNPEHIAALLEEAKNDSSEKKELQLSAAALLKVMHQDKLIKFSSDTLKRTVEQNPEIAMQLLLQTLPEDFETMSKEAPRTLLYLKHNDKLRYDVMIQRHLDQLRKKN